MKVESFAVAAACLMMPLTNASPSLSTDHTKERRLALKDGWDYIGCYSSLSIALSTNATKLSITNSLTPSKCQQVCHENNLGLAALTNGNHCYCQDNMDSLDKQLKNDRCNTVCSGDKNAKCGGPNDELSVWTEKARKLKKAKTKTKTKVVGSALGACRSARKNGKSKSFCNSGHKSAADANPPIPVVGLVSSVFVAVFMSFM